MYPQQVFWWYQTEGSGWYTWRLCWHSAGPWQAGGMGREKDGHVQDPTSGEEEPLVLMQVLSARRTKLVDQACGQQADISQKSALMARRANGILGHIGKSVKWSSPSAWLQVRNIVSGSGLSVQERKGANGDGPVEATKMKRGLKPLSYEKRLGELSSRED